MEAGCSYDVCIRNEVQGTFRLNDGVHQIVVLFSLACRCYSLHTFSIWCKMYCNAMVLVRIPNSDAFRSTHWVVSTASAHTTPYSL